MGAQNVKAGTKQVVMRKTPYDLAEMLDRVNAGNIHAEHDFGPAVGNEEWQTTSQRIELRRRKNG